MEDMKGFEKIDLESTVSTANDSNNQMSKQKRHISNQTKRKIYIGVGIVLLIVIFAFFAIIGPVKKTYADAQVAFQKAKEMQDALKKQDINLASEKIVDTQKSLDVVAKDLKDISYLAFIPVVNWYYNDANHLLNAGSQGLKAGKVLIAAVEPYADVLGLKGKGTFTSGSAEQRIQLAVQTMSKITPKIDDIDGYLKNVKEEIDKVDPNHYPAIFGGQKIKTSLEQARALVDDSVTFVTQARPLIKILPSLLGEPTEKRYLVIFQDDKELRATGGFLTAYGIFRLEHGVIHVDNSSDIYTLDGTISNKPKAPAILSTHLNVNVLNLRDSNLSPDFVTSMQTFMDLYKNSSEYKKVDGVIAIDTHVLVSIIKILDDEVYAGGERFTTKIDPRCDCPSAIYLLFSLIDRPRSFDLRVTNLAEVQARRKDMIGVLLYAIMEKALKSSPKLYWGKLVQDFVTETAQKHVLFDIFNTDAQGGIVALNAAGEIKPFEGDYLHINDTNLGGAKSNMFVKQSVKQDIQIDGSGNVTKTITITYNNTFPASDCNLERGNLCLNADIPNRLRIYVPKGSQLVSSQGSSAKITSYEELGKQVFEGFLTIRAQGQTIFMITYKLPFGLKNNSLPLLIQKQPGTDMNDYLIKVNGRQTDKFQLVTDTLTKLSQ